MKKLSSQKQRFVRVPMWFETGIPELGGQLEDISYEFHSTVAEHHLTNVSSVFNGSVKNQKIPLGFPGDSGNNFV